MESHRSFLNAYATLSNNQPTGSMMPAAQTYDAVYLLLRALLESPQDSSGPALKTALENLPRPYHGVVATYDKPFSSIDHQVIYSDMLRMATWRNGERDYAYKDDEKRASLRGKQRYACAWSQCSATAMKPVGPLGREQLQASAQSSDARR